MEYEPRRTIPETEVSRFVLDDKGGMPEGVTPVLLADLHNLAFTFGAERDRGDLKERILSQGSPSELHVVVNADPSVTSIIVMGEGGQAPEGVYGSTFVSGGIFFWDKRVRAEHVTTFIERVDAVFGERGWIDAETGVRERKEDIIEPLGKRSVERTFRDPTAVFPVPNGMDPRVFREQFDHPERLAAVLTLFGTYALCLVEHCGTILATMRQRMEILSEMGYDEVSLAQLSGDEVMELVRRLNEKERH